MRTTRLLARLIAVTLALAGCGPAFAQADTELVYIGTQGSGAGQGIYAARLDTRTGELTRIGLAAEAARSLWLVARPDMPILYATAEIGTADAPADGVLTLRADRRTGLLTRIGSVSSGGGGPTYLALDLRFGVLFTANYGTGQVAALPVLADGTLASPASVQNDAGAGPTARQKGPHAHMVALDPSRRFVLVPDLGADRLFVYRYDREKHLLSPGEPPFEATPPGTGPRHFAFSPGGKFLYLVTELSPELHTYRWDARNGRLHLVATIPTVDPATRDANKGAEVVASADGRFLYLSNRGEDTIVCYSVDRASGALREVQRIASGGRTPWSMGVDPSGRWLLVTNQGSDTVTVFGRDPKFGRITPTGQSISVPKPVAVAYLNH
jgi:6-phosphogluconolactonase